MSSQVPRTIENPADQETVTFLAYPEETDDGALRYEVRFRAGGKSAHSHFHPTQDQRLEVVSGQMGFEVEGVSKIYGPGEKVHVPKATKHYQWNAGDVEIVVFQEQFPAGEMESFLRNSFGLVRDGRMNTLHAAATLAFYRDVMTHAGWQRWVLVLIAPIAGLHGYKGSYEEYERR
ncbi:MAG: quercetin dioxygenase-like cupin family protein [Hyphomicrobiaceae bacterium]|jgi:quercetin dioxygenase-like cupin family protein